MHATAHHCPTRRFSALQAVGTVMVLFLVAAMPTFLGLMPAETLAQAECLVDVGDSTAAVLAAIGSTQSASERVVAPLAIDCLTATALATGLANIAPPASTAIRSHAGRVAANVALLL